MTEQRVALGVEKVDLEAVFNGLTGFDEIALSQRFNMGIENLQERPSMACRAAMFIDLRNHGLGDADAYKQAMEMSLADVMDRVQLPESDDDEGDQGERPLALTPAL